jgi:hypothetical protein
MNFTKPVIIKPSVEFMEKCDFLKSRISREKSTEIKNVMMLENIKKNMEHCWGTKKHRKCTLLDRLKMWSMMSENEKSKRKTLDKFDEKKSLNNYKNTKRKFYEIPSGDDCTLVLGIHDDGEPYSALHNERTGITYEIIVSCHKKYFERGGTVIQCIVDEPEIDNYRITFVKFHLHCGVRCKNESFNESMFKHDWENKLLDVNGSDIFMGLFFEEQSTSVRKSLLRKGGIYIEDPKVFPVNLKEINYKNIENERNAFNKKHNGIMIIDHKDVIVWKPCYKICCKLIKTTGGNITVVCEDGRLTKYKIRASKITSGEYLVYHTRETMFYLELLCEFPSNLKTNDVRVPPLNTLKHVNNVFSITMEKILLEDLQNLMRI